MLSSLNLIKEQLQLRRNGVFKFQTKTHLKLQMGPYVLKTAENHAELIESFKLRNEVFNLEFRGLTKTKMDFDKYDSIFDHLLIMHTETNKVIGTYRVNCTSNPTNSYSALEFDLSGLLQFKGPYLELGRACIQKDHRRGAVIALLWRGIAEYMKLTGAQTLFGCSSLKINDTRNAALVYRYLQAQGSVVEKNCDPRKNFSFDDFDVWMHYFKNPLSTGHQEEAAEMIPSLLKSYLKLGSKILAKPAFDRDFDCLDFLTVLNRSELSASLDRKFNVNK